jgi:type II secretory pathway pseudopilin PulG
MKMSLTQLLHGRQRGFTLLEVVLAGAITIIVAGGIAMTFIYYIAGNARTTNHMVAVSQAETAGYWLSHDGIMAQTVTLTTTPAFSLELLWSGYKYAVGTSSRYETYEVTYTYNEDEDRLYRTQKTTYFTYDSSGNPATGPAPTTKTAYIAEHISAPPAATFNPLNNHLSFTVTATVGLSTETRTYEAEPRATPIEQE